MHLHLDPVGGIAGDMFIAALVDAFPELGAGVESVLARTGLPPEAHWRVREHRDGSLRGKRFELELPELEHHHHVGLARISKRIAAMGLDAAVAARATDIFSILARAEAAVHGVGVDEVEFHEVGALDSIADIVAAAWLIEALAPATWSVASLPLGAGRVRSAHGLLPVPAPAVTQLLQGFAFHDDGQAGERVTPTGAALLVHLQCASARLPRAAKLRSSGMGYGMRSFAGLPNALRVLAFDEHTAAPGDEVDEIAFEVDDQTPEDLALGLERLRASAGVIDVLQAPVYGKKGRMAAQIQVLARPEHRESVIAACFAETTTLGLRYQLRARRVLARTEVAATGEHGPSVRVKLARRPDGATSAKAESDDLRDAGGHDAREALRRAREAGALRKEGGDGG